MIFEDVCSKYNIIIETRFSMDDSDFNNIVREYLPKLVNKSASDKYKKFECVAEFEWNNDSNFDVAVTESDIEKDSYYDKYGRMEILHGKKFIGLDSILCFLIENKILQFGKYEVKVSW